MSKAARIAVVVSQLGYGGAERQTFELLRALAGTDRAPRLVICLSDQLEPYGPRIRELGYELRSIPRSGSFDLRRLWRLRRLLREERIDLAHAVHLLASGYTWLARGGIAGGRLLPSVRGTVVHPGPAKRWTYRRMLSGCPRTLVNSSSGARFIERHFGAPPERLVVIPNGIDFDGIRRKARHPALRAELGLDPLDELIGFVGKLRPVKNVPRFLEICRELMAERPRLHAALIGHDLLPRECADLTGGIDPSRLHLLGPRPDVPALLPDLGALVLTSNSEGCPNIVLEALCVGVPVVAADVGDVSQMVINGRTGVVAPKERIEAYTAALRRILDRPEAWREEVRADGPRLERLFGLDGMVRRTVDLWQELLALPARAS